MSFAPAEIKIGDTVRPKNPKSQGLWLGKVLSIGSRVYWEVGDKRTPLELKEPQAYVEIVSGAGAGEPWGFRMDKVSMLVRSDS